MLDDDDDLLPTASDMFLENLPSARVYTQAILHTFDAASDAGEDMTIDDLIGWSWDCADMIRDLRMLDELIRKEIKGRAESKKVETTYGVVEIKTETKRTQWDKDALLAHATSRIVELPGVLTDEHGELHPPSAIASNVVAQLRNVVSISGGKVTGMRALGLAPDEFCKEDPQGWSVILPKRPGL